MSEFVEWPKTPRLFKDMTVTEKIDGTNACVVIEVHNLADEQAPWIIDVQPRDDETEYHVFAQSRKRMITPEQDNAGFARWVSDNAAMLTEALGSGRHFGEWWGKGIQRGYDRKGKTFSLFNTGTWGEYRELFEQNSDGELSVVPELCVGPFNLDQVRLELDLLTRYGSVAAPGFMDPEGVCVFHHASRSVFKVTADMDAPKGGPRDEHDNVVAFPTNPVTEPYSGLIYREAA